MSRDATPGVTGGLSYTGQMKDAVLASSSTAARKRATRPGR
jgi:hypothetical protein